MDLSGKVAIVTGAGSGIGAEITRLYLEAGANVVGVDIQPAFPADAVGRLGAGPERLRCLVGDVAKESTARVYTETALDAFGHIDILVNNAAIGLTRRLDETTPEEWARVMGTNVTSIYWSARAVIPEMRRKRSGLILNVGSISSMVGITGQGVYAASKGAVVQMTRQMAVEYAKDGIRVNAVCPGTVDTPLLRKAAEDTADPEAFLQMLAGGHPIGRIAAAEEIAQFFVFLASDRARFFTGAILMIDGGFTAW